MSISCHAMVAFTIGCRLPRLSCACGAVAAVADLKKGIGAELVLPQGMQWLGALPQKIGQNTVLDGLCFIDRALRAWQVPHSCWCGIAKEG